MPFETAKARKSKIVDGFASCAPVLRQSKFDQKEQAKAPMATRVAMKNLAIAAARPAQEEETTAGPHALANDESSKPILEPRISQLSLISKAKSKQSKQAPRLSALSERPAEEKVSEEEEAVEEERDADEVSKHTKESRPPKEKMRREINEFENKYKIKMNKHQVISMIDKLIANKDGMYTPPSKEKASSSKDSRSLKEDPSATVLAEAPPDDAAGSGKRHEGHSHS